jgi:hypothetical protein
LAQLLHNPVDAPPVGYLGIENGFSVVEDYDNFLG